MEPFGGVVRPLSMRADTEASTSGQLRPSDFETFYQQAWDSVYRPLAVTVGDIDLAAEAVDEAMLRAFAKWRLVQRMDNREGWVYRVAYRWAIDRIRRLGRERRLAPQLVDTRTSEPSIVEPGLDAALESMPLNQRSVVVLSCAFDWSESQIADALGIRPGTVKSRLHRGLEHLRREMKV
jgi:RNA polymerase sigma-70 factor (ECF subfamily)